MNFRCLFAACALPLSLLAVAAVPADETPPPATEPAAPQPPLPGSYTPYFPSILKEGQSVSAAAREQAEARRAAERQAGWNQAVQESWGLALRIGRFAITLVLAILIAAGVGALLAFLVAGIRSWRERRREKGRQTASA